MAMRFKGVLLGCSVAPSKVRNGKVRLNIRSLGGKTSDSEHFVIILLPGWKQDSLAASPLRPAGQSGARGFAARPRLTGRAERG